MGAVGVAEGLAPGEREAEGVALGESRGGVLELEGASALAAPLGVREAEGGALCEAGGAGELAGVCDEDGGRLGVPPAGVAGGVAAGGVLEGVASGVSEGEASGEASGEVSGGEAEDVAVGESAAEAEAPVEDGVAEGSVVGEGAAGDAVGEASPAGDGDACPSPVTRRRALPPLSARKRSPPTNALPMGVRNVAAVPAPFVEPDDPLPASVVTASVAGSRERRALLDASLIMMSPEGLMVMARGL
jgi:hypothetical protein